MYKVLSLLFVVSALVPQSAKAQNAQALVMDPPSNVRSSPNGAIQCSVNRSTYINIYGSTSNGQWFKTDYCGGSGYIHSSQITQPESVQSAPSPTSGYCILRGRPVPDHFCY